MLKRADIIKKVLAKLKFSDFPEHPDSVIIRADNYNYTSNITEETIWKYYDKVKKQILPFLKDKDLFVVLKTKTGQIYMRHPWKGKSEYIRINNSDRRKYLYLRPVHL